MLSDESLMTSSPSRYGSLEQRKLKRSLFLLNRVHSFTFVLSYIAVLGFHMIEVLFMFIYVLFMSIYVPFMWTSCEIYDICGRLFQNLYPQSPSNLHKK